MKPIGKYIAITPIEEQIRSKSGLVLSGQDVSDFRYKKGVVSEPGTDVHGIKKGDTIYYDSMRVIALWLLILPTLSSRSLTL